MRMDNEEYLPEELSTRERILRNFEILLDQVLEQQQQPPAGIPQEIWQELANENIDDQTEAQVDLYEMWSVLTVLAQESKLQARGFKQLQEAVVASTDTIKEISTDTDKSSEQVSRNLSRLEDEIAKLRQQQNQQRQDLEYKLSADFIGIFIDIRERLLRGQTACRDKFQSASKRQKCVLGKFCKSHKQIDAYSESLESLLKGYTLNLEHLEEILHRLELHETDCLGRRFDPLTMTAVELDTNSQAADGTVLEVYASGYTWRGKVFRPAQVKVARKNVNL